MQKQILITGATDGLGLATATKLAQLGHKLLIHGRSSEKLARVKQLLIQYTHEENLDFIEADLSELKKVYQMCSYIKQRYNLDIIINNAGIYNTPNSQTQDGLDTRFAVNTFAPYIITTRLLESLNANARVINLSSAAQSPVDLEALLGNKHLNDSMAYAQSKLALTGWTTLLGKAHQKGPMMVSVNPKSLLASKMVKNAYGIAGSDISVGVNILLEAALKDSFANAHGLYYDNDIESFASPHPDALNEHKSQLLIETMEAVLGRLT